MSFRKEYKYRLSHYEMQQFLATLISKGMTRLFADRRIDSVYFDNYQMSSFRDSEEGTLPRKKLRIRFYNEKPYFNFETKISSIEGRFKTVKKLKNLNNENAIWLKSYIDDHYGLIIPRLKISYDRSYFELNGLRVTVDKNITYNHPKLQFYRTIKDPENVIEIKCSSETSDDYIQSIIHHKTSRFSKYCRGVLSSDWSYKNI